MNERTKKILKLAVRLLGTLVLLSWVVSKIDLSQVMILGLWNPSDHAEAFVSCEVIVDDIRFE